MSHTLDMLQQHQQPLQQCAALFSHIQTFLKGMRLGPRICTACQADWGHLSCCASQAGAAAAHADTSAPHAQCVVAQPTPIPSHNV